MKNENNNDWNNEVRIRMKWKMKIIEIMKWE